MTFRNLEIFVTVCETGGVTAAAEALFLSQPVVSMVIKNLEKEYNIKLFERISRTVYLTSAGKELYGYATHILSLMHEADDKLKRGGEVAEVRVGSSITIGTHYMPIAAKRFLEQYPYCPLIVKVNSSAVIEEMLLMNRLDFAIIEGIAQSKFILSERICEDKLIPVFSPSHPFAGMGTITAEQFFSEKMLLREPTSGTRAQFDSVAACAGKKIQPLWESTSTSALINAVSSGLGISVLPYKLVETELRSGKLQTARIEGITFKRYFNLVYHKNKQLSPIVRNCIHTCRQTLSADSDFAEI